MTEMTTAAAPADGTAGGIENSAATLRRIAACKRVTPLASALAALIGASVLVGWIFHIPFLKSVLPNLPVMVPNTALCLLLAGIALRWIGDEGSAPLLRGAGQVCALFVTLVGLLTFFEYVSRHSLGLDLLLVRSAAAFPGSAFPGRPSPQTAISLCLLGGALLSLSTRERPGYRSAQRLAIAAAVVCLMAFSGYLFDTFFSDVSAPKWMAAHGLLARLALSVGILCARPDQGIMAVITSDSAGGITARRLLPAVILLPLLLGWLRYLGEHHGLYDTATGTSLMVLATIGLLIVLLLTNAQRLHTLDARRQEAMDALQQANGALEARVRERTADLNAQREWLRVTLTSIGDAVIATGTDGSITFMNAVAEAMTGWRQEEAIGKDLDEVFVIRNEETGKAVESPAAKVLQEGAVVGLANHTLLIARDGTETPIDDTGAPIRDDQGNLSGVVLIFHDITERQQAEQALRASEQRFRLLFADNPLPMWVFDPDTLAFLEVNEAAVAHYGYSRDEFLHMKVTEIRPEEEVPRLLAIIRDSPPGLLATGVWRHRTKEGRIIDVEILTHALDVAERKATLVVAQDVTARKQAEEALRESETLYRTLGEAVPDFVWACKANGEPLYVNRRWTEYTGLTLEQCGDIPMDVLHHPEDFPHLEERWTEAAALRESYEAEVRYRRHDGTYRWFMARAVPVTDEQGHIVQWIGTSTDIHERKMADQALRESEEQFRATFDQAAVGIAHVRADGKWLRVNQKLCDIVGYRHEELLACTFQDITHPDDLDADLAYVRQVLAGEIPTYSMEKRYFRKDGSVVWINLTVSLVRQPSGEPKYFISVVEDITERKRLEEQLLQAQKLESIGRLAGGVAHDFNNLLTVIAGHAELAKEDLAADAPLLEHIRAIQQAGDRAANLTSQLLAFARKQIIAPKVLSLNDLARDMDKMLRRLIGENIELVTRLSPSPGLVNVDPGQFEQILVNLAVNARDAMPEGGKLTIETANVTVDAEYALQHPPVVAGEYVLVSVSDTGIGMEDSVQEHIFEPFFTTKEQGKGTGLGLATVYGIVHQAGGHIWLYSEAGQGTTFKVYLPRVQETVEALPERAGEQDRPRGTETILVVEDEPALRTLAVVGLRKQGYTVLEAANGEQALQIAAAYAEPIQLLVTDVIMPQMGGKELAGRLQSVRPGFKILYTSGYTDDAIVHHGVLEADVAFLQKPFSPTTLARKVREVLEG